MRALTVLLLCALSTDALAESAIAIGDLTGTTALYGYISEQLSTFEAAERHAISKCHQTQNRTNCRVVLRFKGTCAAFASGTTSAKWAARFDVNISEARDRARTDCKALTPNGACTLDDSACDTRGSPFYERVVEQAQSLPRVAPSPSPPPSSPRTTREVSFSTVWNDFWTVISNVFTRSDSAESKGPLAWLDFYWPTLIVSLAVPALVGAVVALLAVFAYHQFSKRKSAPAGATIHTLHAVDPEPSPARRTRSQPAPEPEPEPEATPADRMRSSLKDEILGSRRKSERQEQPRSKPERESSREAPRSSTVTSSTTYDF